MDLSGLRGWRWIFLLEGMLSVVIGASCFFLMADSPSKASWLKPEEAKFLELSHIAYRGVRTNAKTTDPKSTQRDTEKAKGGGERRKQASAQAAAAQ